MTEEGGGAGVTITIAVKARASTVKKG